MSALLIVDDHRHLVESLATTIDWTALGVARVFQAFSGPEALDALAAHEIAVVVTDIRMPAMSGLDLIRVIRRDYPRTACILLTGYADFEYARDAVKLQAADYLMKPVRHAELIRVVTEQLERRRTADEAEAEKRHRIVREERERIARDIHDVVGYTLTSSLVQLEAARRQLSAGMKEGMERLAISQEMLRKSIDNVRGLVGMIRLEAGTDEGDLETAMERFASEAEKAADIAVERRYALDEPIFGADVKKALLHALQEGITNGLRHGRATRFRLALETASGELRFALWNDGLPYESASPGFGLTGMRDRIERLGGTVRLQAAGCGEGEGEGTLLAIRVPLAGR